MINTYAKIENEIVTNIISCTDSEISTFSGLFVKVTEDTNNPYIGGRYSLSLQKFEEIEPYPSWEFNEQTFKWESPSTKPEGNFHWNETDQEWVEFIPKPGPGYNWDESLNNWVPLS